MQLLPEAWVVPYTALLLIGLAMAFVQRDPISPRTFYRLSLLWGAMFTTGMTSLVAHVFFGAGQVVVTGGFILTTGSLVVATLVLRAGVDGEDGGRDGGEDLPDEPTGPSGDGELFASFEEQFRRYVADKETGLGSNDDGASEPERVPALT